MKKIKKVLIGIGLFFISFATKVYAAFNPTAVTSLYAVDPGVNSLYAVDSGRVVKEYLRLGKVIIPFILFIIGLVVVLSKKISKKVKIIVASILTVLAISTFVIMQIISNNI